MCNIIFNKWQLDYRFYKYSLIEQYLLLAIILLICNFIDIKHYLTIVGITLDKVLSLLKYFLSLLIKCLFFPFKVVSNGKGYNHEKTFDRGLEISTESKFGK